MRPADLSWRWAAAYGAVWLVLAIGAEGQATADLSAALAWTIALSAAIALWPAIKERNRL